jgi:deoxyhypusine synthase
MSDQSKSQDDSKSVLPAMSTSAVLAASDSLPESTPTCGGMDFSKATSEQPIIDQIMNSFKTTGFQATNLGLAVEQINEMRKWRLSDTEWKEGDDEALKPLEVRKRIRARIFLSYTSNQISSGQREVIRFLVQNKMVDCIVTTGGGIEEDIIKCFQPTYMGDFKLNGHELRKKGINRIGNLLIPNNNYCEFEDWLTPLIREMHKEQNEKWMEWLTEMNNRGEDDDVMPPKFVWTPSKVIHRLGKELEHIRNHEESVLYWAAKNDIPIFSPALTDGSLGDMLYFHSYKMPGFVLDIAEDIRRINDMPVKSHATGMIILGGGLVKHHVCNANLMRNGADYSVFINTGQEFDGSDSGASPDEAVSWGKIRMTAKPVKVSMDATVAFPLIVSQTFAKDVEGWKEAAKDTVCHVDELE